MNCSYACNTFEHVASRRTFLGGMMAGLGLGSVGPFLRGARATQLEKNQKQVLVIWLAGGASQLETWDPKPGTPTGGPFRAIDTSVPGVKICELLPKTSRLMHLMALVRGVNTHAAGMDDHGKGHYVMHTGRTQTPAGEYPHLGAVMARFLPDANQPLPGYIYIQPGGGGVGGNEAAYLGPKYAPLYLGNGQAPSNTQRSLAPEVDAARHAMRRQINDHFAKRRRTAETEAYTTTYEQALQLMERREVFDVTKEPAADQDRYGSHDFGRHCLMARRLLENGATFVQVSHSNYDTHNENFAFHLEQLGEFDQGFANLLGDLSDRGRLQNTLVIVMSEFGRTPNINYLYGRDHWDTAWSIALAGSGLKPGNVLGKTDPKGTSVVDGQVHGGHLFHTYLKAVGLDPKDDFEIDGRSIQIADPTASAITELLA